MTDLSLCPSPLLPLHIISIRVSPAMEFQGNTRSDCLLKVALCQKEQEDFTLPKIDAEKLS